MAEALGDMSARVLSFRQRFNFIRAQQGEQREIELFKALNREYYRMIRKSIFLRAVIGPGTEFLGFAIFALILFLMSQEFWNPSFGPAELIQFFGALGLMLKPLKVLGEQFARIQETAGALKESLDVFSLAARPDHRHLLEQKQSVSKLELGSIEAGYDDKVCFKPKIYALSEARLSLLLGRVVLGKVP